MKDLKHSSHYNVLTAVYVLNSFANIKGSQFHKMHPLQKGLAHQEKDLRRQTTKNWWKLIPSWSLTSVGSLASLSHKGS